MTITPTPQSAPTRVGPNPFTSLPMQPSLLDDIEPAPVRGVVATKPPCSTCGLRIPVLGLPGRGRPMSEFPFEFCEGHTMYVDPVQALLNDALSPEAVIDGHMDSRYPVSLVIRMGVLRGAL